MCLIETVILWRLMKFDKVSSFFFSFGVLQLMLPEAPQPYGLLYYDRIGHSNFLHQFRAATPPKQRKLELWPCNLDVSNFRH
jgi:hypothetical protein